jgi:hypothetical protein
MAIPLGKRILDLETEIIPAFLDRIFAVEHQGYHRDIGTLQSLRRAQAEFPSGGLQRG